MRTLTVTLNQARNVTLSAYLLDDSAELANTRPRRAILVLPGGAYQFCSDREAEPVALAYAASGYQAFVLRYSVAEHALWPNPLEDVEAALTHIRENADGYGLDPVKVAVIGFSAGGHLAAAVSSLSANPPAATILGYPLTLAVRAGALVGSAVPDTVESVTGAHPPTFLFSTADDPVVPIAHTLGYIDALQRAGVSWEAHILRSGAHGLSLARPHTSSGNPVMVNPVFAEWFARSLQWLGEVLGEYGSSPEV